jgi:hypothetical protein
MRKEVNLRQDEILKKYPAIKTSFEDLCDTRREEIINELLMSDTDYQLLTQRRADTSEAVLRILSEQGATDPFESYSDAVYAEEVYELDVIYREAFFDAVETMERMKIL